MLPQATNLTTVFRGNILCALNPTTNRSACRYLNNSRIARVGRGEEKSHHSKPYLLSVVF